MILLILFLSLASAGRDHPSIRAHYPRPQSEQVALSLASDRSSYYVREPIRLKLTLKNVQGKPVHGFFIANPLSPKAEIRYRRIGSSFGVFPYPGRKGGYVDSPAMLRPEEELTGEETLTFDSTRQAFVLDEPGEYEFQVIYRDAPQEPNALLESAVLAVQVQPAPDSERGALAAYSKDLAILAQFNPRWTYVSPEVIHLAVEFLDRFPSSPYAHSVRSGLHGALRQRVTRNRATNQEQQLYEKLEREMAPHQ
jgi:hypothetical protein